MIELVLWAMLGVGVGLAVTGAIKRVGEKNGKRRW